MHGLERTNVRNNKDQHRIEQNITFTYGSGFFPSSHMFHRSGLTKKRGQQHGLQGGAAVRKAVESHRGMH